VTALVLLPGLDGTGLLFQPLVQALSKDIEPIVVSYPDDVPLDYQELLPLVEEALPSRPFVLLGESFSGPLAIMAATSLPPGLRGVILCASFVRSPMAYLPAWCANLVRPFLFRCYPAVAHVRLLLGHHADPTVRDLAAQTVSRVRPQVLAHRVRAVHRVDVAEQLASCPVPVLYLRGQRDWLVPASAMRRVLRACPHAQVVNLSAPHMVLQTQPAAAAAAIRTFVRSSAAVAAHN
jgi:pimeloyl-[acyl-carrier protein] methyl ester esterase